MIDITMREYRFDFSSAIPAGRVAFQVQNRGRLDHDLVLVPLPEDMPPLTFDPHSPNQRGLSTLALLPPRHPGGNGLFAVDLIPGRYAVICFVTDPDGVQHATKGMHLEFRVR